MVGIVVVSHSPSLARGLAELAGQMAGPEVRIEAVGGTSEGTLGTDSDGVESAIGRADCGDGVIVLGDIGSAILTIRTVLESQANGHVRLVDAPFVEGAVTAAVTSSAGGTLDQVARAAEDARGAHKL